MMTTSKNKKSLIKPVVGFFISLIITVIAVSMIFSLAVYAIDDPPATTTLPAVTTTAPPMTEQPPTTTEEIVTTVPYDIPPRDADEIDSGLLGALDINDNNGSLELILIITILTLAPSILLMMTCFTRIIIVFSLLRNAMGIQQTPPNQVLIGLALFLSLFIMSPVIAEINEVAYVPYKAGEFSTVDAAKAATVPLKKYMLKQTSNESMQFFLDLAKKPMPTGTHEEIAANIEFQVVAPAYILSEIKTGFTIGFILFIPFLIIDIVVSSALMSLGMIMLPPAMIALPFKILLFILVNGWQMLVGALVKGFN